MSINKTLFEIGEDMRALDDLLDEAGGDVTGEVDVIEQWMDENASHMEEKIDGYYWYLKELSHRADAIKAEEKELRKRRKTYENRASRLKDHLQWFMERFGHEQVEGATHRAKLQSNGGRLPLVVKDDLNPESLPEEFRRVRVSIDKNKIRDAADGEPGYIALVNGELVTGLDELVFAEGDNVQVIGEIEERGQHIRFY